MVENKMWTFLSWAWGRDCQWLRALFILKLNLHPHFSLPVGVLGYVALTIHFVTALASTWYGFSNGCRYLFLLFRLLLRCDLQLIKCTHSKYRTGWVLTNEYICVTAATIKTEYFCHPKKVPHATLQSAPSPTSHSPGQPLISFLSL